MPREEEACDEGMPSILNTDKYERGTAASLCKNKEDKEYQKVQVKSKEAPPDPCTHTGAFSGIKLPIILIQPHARHVAGTPLAGNIQHTTCHSTDHSTDQALILVLVQDQSRDDL